MIGWCFCARCLGRWWSSDGLKFIASQAGKTHTVDGSLKLKVIASFILSGMAKEITALPNRTSHMANGLINSKNSEDTYEIKIFHQAPVNDLHEMQIYRLANHQDPDWLPVKVAGHPTLHQLIISTLTSTPFLPCWSFKASNVLVKPVSWSSF